MTNVQIRSLTKSYGSAVGVQNVSLGLGSGEFLSLLGPSGCGKTTTLRCLAGFVDPDEGRIEFDGTNVVGQPPEKRNLGMVFQNYALFPHMTVAQNLAFGLEIRRLESAEVRARVERILAMVHLSGYEGRYPRELSGGQQQRVALARALVIKPSILLLDEPLANLDAKLREEMCAFMRSLQRQSGITAVYVTHDQDEALLLSDRIAVMFDGRVHQVGTAEEIYTRPADRRVAEFIGRSNFFTGTVSQRLEGGEAIVSTSLGTVRCRGAGKLDLSQAISILVRPESIRLLASETAEEALVNQYAGAIEERHFHGSWWHYVVLLKSQSRISVQASPLETFAVGDEVHVRFDPDSAWVLPSDSRRIGSPTEHAA